MSSTHSPTFHGPAALGRRIDHDRLNLVGRKEAADTAQTALFGIQDEDPEVQVMGVAVLFYTQCDRLGLDPEETYHKARRLVGKRDPGNRTVQDSLSSLRSFVGRRLGGFEDTLA